MAKLNKNQIIEFEKNPVWNEILARVGQMLEQADKEIEYSDPFAHGIAVGKRATLRTFADLTAILIQESEGGGYGGKG